MLSSLAPLLAVLTTAAVDPPQAIAVLDVVDQRPTSQRPPDNAVQRAFETVLTESKRFQIVPRKPGQNARCTEDECRMRFARELGVERVLATQIETGHGECLVTATILNAAKSLPEVVAYRPTACDQTSVLAIVKNELGPALRRDQGSVAVAAPKMKLVPLSDRRIVGDWEIKHVGSLKGTPPNLTGAQLHFGADGQFRGDGKVYVDRKDEPGELSLAGPYGFDGKVLGIRNWGAEFENCAVMTKKPATLKPAAVKESELTKQTTCKLYFETPDKIWIWYPGPAEGVILDTWTRAKASKQ
jgi:hypothetical protein